MHLLVIEIIFHNGRYYVLDLKLFPPKYERDYESKLKRLHFNTEKKLSIIIVYSAFPYFQFEIK